MSSLSTSSFLTSWYRVKSSGVNIPIGRSALLVDLSTTSRCLTLFCNIRSAAIDGDSLESIVIRGEDINSLFVTVLKRISLMHAFLTKSRSVIRPLRLPSLSTTNNELTFFSFIFLADSCTDSDSPMVSIFFLMKSLTVVVIMFQRLTVVDLYTRWQMMLEGDRGECGKHISFYMFEE